MSELNIVELISTTGFPIAVTIFLLYERYKSARELNQQMVGALQDLKNVIIELKGLIERLGDKL